MKAPSAAGPWTGLVSMVLIAHLPVRPEWSEVTVRARACRSLDDHLPAGRWSARRRQVTRHTIRVVSHADVNEDLLLFRAVADPARRSMAARLLDEGIGARAWRCRGEADLWELSDATCGPGEQPVAVAATCVVGDGRHVRLLGVLVDPALRGRGLGRRVIEQLADALRARGALALVAAVPSDHPAATAAVQRAGLRPSHVERASPESDGRDLVWFDVEL